MRRIFLPTLTLGDQPLPADQAHHLRDVLRLLPGAAIEAFDRAGHHARGELVSLGASEVVLRISMIEADAPGPRIHLTIAAAIPKAARADWMIEKLSELGTDVFIPLVAARSVVVPQGQSKFDRWNRLAEESAKQCGRNNVMRIDPVTPLHSLLDRHRAGSSDAPGEMTFYLSTEPTAPPLMACLFATTSHLTLLIGPEGGWTDQELSAFASAQISARRLTRTILRVETAAIAAAAIVESALTSSPSAATINLREND